MKCKCEVNLQNILMKINNNISGAEFVQKVLSLDKNIKGWITYTDIQLIQNKPTKRDDVIKIIHSYCPFCGVKLINDDE